MGPGKLERSRYIKMIKDDRYYKVVWSKHALEVQRCIQRLVQRSRGVYRGSKVGQDAGPEVGPVVGSDYHPNQTLNQTMITSLLHRLHSPVSPVQAKPKNQRKEEPCVVQRWKKDTYVPRKAVKKDDGDSKV